jgi:hypothetical protein
MPTDFEEWLEHGQLNIRRKPEPSSTISTTT